MSAQETKTCQNCQKPFVIEPEDFAFYEKISAKGGSASGGKVPPPTWCPECRMVRRFLFRGWRKLYKRKVEGYDGEVYSKYPSDSGLKIYHENYYHSDAWDSMEYGRDYDFSHSFFKQFAELFRVVPKSHRDIVGDMIGSEYCDNAGYLKNCYLVFNTGFSENCAYGTDVNGSRDCIDAVRIKNCELCYDIFDAENCHRVHFSTECVQCSDIWFSKNLVGCHNCFGCIGLRNKEYHIFNQPYSKEEYFRKLQEFDLSSSRAIEELRGKIFAFWLGFPVRFMHGYQCVNSTGDYIYHSKNARDCFNVENVEDCKYVSHSLFVKTADSMDVAVAGGNLLYEGMLPAGSRLFFGFDNAASTISKSGGFSGSVDLQYCARCHDSSNLFGCIGLRNKQHCILNQQYTKEEYEALVPKIIEHMNEMPYISRKSEARNPKSETNSKSEIQNSKSREIIYRYGEFFPPELSPFAYNETIAQEYFPLTKEEALAQGYRWKEQEEKEYTPTISWRDLPDHINDVSDSILNEAILCSAWDEDAKKAQEHNCTKVFRIISQELAFYRKMNLPLPRFCPNSRHFHRIQQRNPLKLWHRVCTCAGVQSQNGIYQNTASHIHGATQCPNEFETSYAPERPEIVYCEQCYQSEVV